MRIVDNRKIFLRRYFKDLPLDTPPSEILRLWRTRKNLTQGELAELMGIYQPHVAQMESGQRPIGRETAQRLGAALGLSSRIFWQKKEKA